MSRCLTLKKSNCKNCHKCIRHCPVKSIRFTGDQAQIISDECVLCGQCFVVCPQNAKEIVNDVEKIKVLIMSGDPVIISMAPSFIANYDGCGIESMRRAIKQLGFYDVEETAIGATIVKNDFERIIDTETRSVIISSCCHSVNLLIQKHFPDLLDCLAETMSPMQAHCIDIKKRYPHAKTVFIGPCVAKKDEAERYDGIVDAAITFEDLSEWLAEEGITVEQEMDSNDESRARFFPTAGGVLKTMQNRNPNYTYMAIDGMHNCIAALEDIRKGNIDHCFIEMNACAGACINGPVMEKYHYNIVKDYLAISRYAGEQDFPVEQPEHKLILKVYENLEGKKDMPNESAIREILAQMGKTAPEDELNCGTCGYETCREKAIAVYQGKAEISMCLPYLKDKSENFSNLLFENSPVGLITVNYSFEIQQINPAACEIFNIKNYRNVLGEQVVTILDPKPFFDAMQQTRIVYESMYLAEYGKYVEVTIFKDATSKMMFCLIEDVTDVQSEREKKINLSKQTVATADQVVEKQMRIVQEIASLLGETAAETKIALTNLKESIDDE